MTPHLDDNPTTSDRRGPRILLTGATGYVGGRLLPVLEAQGCAVRCVTRRAGALRGSVKPSTEVVEGDLRDAHDVEAALDGIDIAYYLVHAMGSKGDFAKSDRESAELFGATARRAGVKTIVYLGGLGDGPDLSAHLESRQEVGRILRASGVPTVEFRASIIIGSGSLSFDLIASLVRRLPVMLTPRWVRTRTQPIAIDDVTEYLAATAGAPVIESRVYEIGGPERVTYSDLMAEYAKQCGLRRLIIPVPVLTPTISSLWLGLVTPLYARVGRQLLDGVRNETVVRDLSARQAFPAITPRGVTEAIAQAIADGDAPATRWADALPEHAGSTLSEAAPGRRFYDVREIRLDVPPATAFNPIQRIGGRTGWHSWNSLWRVRGYLDMLVGGVGLRRGRRHPVHLRPGDALDFWRVEAVEEGRLLRLRAEMRLPGLAWLEFRVEPDGAGTVVRQIATFAPNGLFGRLYWWVLSPFHRLVFPSMLKRLGREAVRAADAAR
jgi:uncharacterized protein YbjT (DUF2867 family)